MLSDFARKPSTSDSTRRTTRRKFVSHLASAVAVVAGGASIANAADAPTQFQIQPNSLMRVRIEVDLKGNVNVPSNPLISREKEKSVPLTSSALFDYEERYHDRDDSKSVAIERFYHKASSTRDIAKASTVINMRDSVRQVHIRRDQLPETTYAVDDYFTQEELGLIKIPVCSAAVDQLLPTKAVSVGEKYKVGEAEIASLLNLAAVNKTDVEIEVVEIKSTRAKFQMTGNVHGSVNGVPTMMRVVGKMTFDREIGTCTWLAIALHETRDIGKAEPGFDVAATIKMVRQPLPKVVALPARPFKFTATVPSNRMYVDLQSKSIDVAMLMDRRWKIMRDITGSVMMRMIDNDNSIAQCNIRPLASLEAGKQWTLEAFQQDIKTALGSQLSEFLQADQRLSASGLRVMRVVAQGSAEGVPIQWIMLHFSDDSGRRVQATFTMESDSVTKFAGADVQLANSLRFTTPAPESTTEPESRVSAKPAVRN